MEMLKYYQVKFYVKIMSGEEIIKNLLPTFKGMGLNQMWTFKPASFGMANKYLFSFCRNKARPIYTNTISWTFHQLVPELDLYIPPGVSPPQLHCLRHSFAVGTLLHWYRTGIDPARRLIHLSTFLGHVSPSSTAVYLTITTELLQSANERFEQFATPFMRETEQ